jgi:hypothetical protein
MNHQLVCPINLNFNINWSRIRKIYGKLTEKINQGVFPIYSEPAYKAVRYDIGSYGSLITSTTLTESEWIIWAGELLETVLPPELLQLRQDMIAEGLNFNNFNYFQHSGSIATHRDGKRIGEAPTGHCNLNFIVSCENLDAKTVAYSDTIQDHEESYYGVNSWWLLDTFVRHQVINTGNREVFQLKIFDPFEKVKKFFENRNEVLV